MIGFGGPVDRCSHLGIVNGITRKDARIFYNPFVLLGNFIYYFVCRREDGKSILASDAYGRGC